MTEITTTPLAVDDTIDTGYILANGYGYVTLSVYADTRYIATVDWSYDQSNIEKTYTYQGGVNNQMFEKIAVRAKYYKITITNNSGLTMTELRAYYSETDTTGAAVIPSAVTAYGVTDQGTAKAFSSTSEGHLEVAIHDPIAPFGELIMAELTPVFQIDGVYGVNAYQTIQTISGSGGISGSNNMMICSTGGAINSAATIQSKRRIRYRPGQGTVLRFTSLWSTPSDGSIVISGMGTSESGFYVGYNGTQFGVLHTYGGVREVRTLTVTTASTSTQNAQITLDGTSYTVAMTNNNNTLRTAYEISRGNYNNAWAATCIGSTVVFVSGSAYPRDSTYSVAQSGAVTPIAGTFARTVIGVVATSDWVYQDDWNADKLDGLGASGYTINPAKGNIFQIEYAYLGFGSVVFRVMVTEDNSNNHTFIRFHEFKFPNTLSAPHTTQPSMPFTMTAYSTTSVDTVTVSSASVAAFICGHKELNGPRFSYTRTSTAVSSGAYYVLQTIRNANMYNGRPNQVTVNIISFGGAHDDATPVTLFLLKNATLVGNPNFTQWSTSSVTYVDTAATTCTISDNNQIIISIPLGQGGSGFVQFDDEVVLYPGETLTIAATAVTGTATYTISTLNTREDQ